MRRATWSTHTKHRHRRGGDYRRPETHQAAGEIGSSPQRRHAGGSARRARGAEASGRGQGPQPRRPPRGNSPPGHQATGLGSTAARGVQRQHHARHATTADPHPRWTDAPPPPHRHEEAGKQAAANRATARAASGRPEAGQAQAADAASRQPLTSGSSSLLHWEPREDTLPYRPSSITKLWSDNNSF